MVWKNLLIVVGLGLLVPAWGQEGVVIDSLKNELRNSAHTAAELGLVHNELAYHYSRVNPDSALFFAQKAKKAGEKAENAKLVAEAMNSMAKAYLTKNKLDSTILIVENALEWIDEEKYAEACATLYMTKGSAYFYQSNLIDAVKSFETSARLYAEAGDTKKQEGALANMGTVLLSKEEFKRSKAIFEKLTQSADPQVEQNAYSNLGSIAGFQGRLEESLRHLEDALRVGKQNNLDTLRTKLNLAITNEKLGDDDIAIQLYEEVKSSYEKVGARRLQGKTAYNLAYLYVNQGKYEKALAEIELAERLLDVSNTQEWLELYNVKHEVLKNLGDYKKAYESLDKSYQLRDSLFKSEKTAAVTEIETRYQTEQKELENQALQRKTELQASINRNQWMGIFGLGGGLLLLGGFSYLLYRQRQRVQAQKSEIELLHREQRHRMMNNLVFANSLMGLQVRRLAEQPEAQQAVKEAESRLNAMSALHRRLHHDGEGQKSISLHGYLQEVTSALQRSFSSPESPIRINLHCPEEAEVDGDAAMRISLIVNELATNSCKHAFAEQPEPQIDVRLEPQPNTRYRLVYTDNGSGLPADFQVDTKQSMGLYLLHNLVKQLNGRIAFSGEEGTRVECELDLEAA